jgi:fibro-slime domain-containing protein
MGSGLATIRAVQRSLLAGGVSAVILTFFGTSCARSELYTPSACQLEGEVRACANPCGPGEQACVDGQWETCQVPVATRSCSNDCGSGVQQCVDGAWQSHCETPLLQRDCKSVCGPGHETCSDGKWRACDARQPKPPRLKAYVRDFSPGPDFEARYPNMVDTGIVQDELGDDDTPVYAGMPTTPTTSGAENFYKWYHDDPSNLGMSLELQLDPAPDEPGWFQHSDDHFFPIDGQLKGNEGRPHNYHFTLQASTVFEYRGGEHFSFAGDDDMWVFINRRLAINLGGTHTRRSLEVALDELAPTHHLERGQVYPLHFFFAERHTVSSTFTLRTTIADPGSCD